MRFINVFLGSTPETMVLDLIILPFSKLMLSHISFFIVIDFTFELVRISALFSIATSFIASANLIVPPFTK